MQREILTIPLRLIGESIKKATYSVKPLLSLLFLTLLKSIHTVVVCIWLYRKISSMTFGETHQNETWYSTASAHLVNILWVAALWTTYDGWHVNRRRDLPIIIHILFSRVDDETWNRSHCWDSMRFVEACHVWQSVQHKGCLKLVHCNVIMVVQMPTSSNAIVCFTQQKGTFVLTVSPICNTPDLFGVT